MYFSFIFYWLRYPALPRLICNLLSILKMCPSAFRVSSPLGPGEQGRGSNLHQNLPWTGGLQNFIKIAAGVWISITPPHTNRRTNKHLYVHLYIYRLYHNILIYHFIFDLSVECAFWFLIFDANGMSRLTVWVLMISSRTPMFHKACTLHTAGYVS